MRRREFHWFPLAAWWMLLHPFFRGGSNDGGLVPACLAMFEEEAGQLDVLVATAGHGSTMFVVVGGDGGEEEASSVVTSDATDTLSRQEDDDPMMMKTTTSCIVASRSLETGQVLWRRNVCSATSQQQQQQHAVISTNKNRSVVTLDQSGAVRSWDVKTGSLQWESMVELDPLFNNNEDEEEDDSRVRVRLSADGTEEDTQIKILRVSAGEGSPLQSLQASTGQVLESSEEATTIVEEDDIDPKKPFQTVSCQEMGVQLSIDSETNTLVSKQGESIPLALTLTESQQESPMLLGLHLVSCSQESLSFVVITSRTTTSLVRVVKAASQGLEATTLWTAEDGLSSLTAGLLVDASHFVPASVGDGGAGNNDSPDPSNLLSFSSRLSMHWKALQNSLNSLLLLPSSNIMSNSASFGFSKVAVLVSDISNRVYGMDMTPTGRGRIKYLYDLPATAKWHKLVHGAPNAAKNVQGINGKAHFREVLLVSSSSSSSSNQEEITWLCLDGATGLIHDQGSITVSDPVIQVVPIPTASTSGGAFSSSSSCRQGALLMLENSATAVIPAANDAIAAAQIAAVPTTTTNPSNTNGWFAHRLSREPARLESFRLSPETSSSLLSIMADAAGTAQFPNERIVTVAYPNREEMIQSPCHVLGDQSLLLKYLNPHLVVLVTVSTTTEEETTTVDASGGEAPKDPFSKAFQSVHEKKGEKQPKRKPLGVTPSSETQAATPTTPTESDPNLFVNVVDSVSGRVLYRASHKDAVVGPVQPSVVISENWIIYSFMNERTRRAEVGVLSLYEGMVDKNGLTPFTSPDQLREFSSFNARESKPVVLAKTYSVAKPITALGITATRGGISGKRLILACLDGQVYAVDRKMLEPRRPMGQVKDSEQQEGLRQYSELIPLVSYMSLSYTQTVEGVKHIVSAPTDLESQTLVLAFGGPDIFFTRTSPSRGFDLLPESFNRIMLSIVVVVLIGIWLILQRIVFGKTVNKGWV